MPLPVTDLVEPRELAGQLGQENLVLIDTRDREVFQRSHLPGAVNIQDIFYYLCLPENGGLAALQAHFTDLFSQAGIRPTDRVIVYERPLDNGYGKSCRGWLSFNTWGMPTWPFCTAASGLDQRRPAAHGRGRNPSTGRSLRTGAINARAYHRFGRNARGLGLPQHAPSSTAAITPNGWGRIHSPLRL